MRYSAQIQWVDDETTEDVIISTDDFNEKDDDEIFFYFESEKEMDNFKREGVNDFILLSYSPE